MDTPVNYLLSIINSELKHAENVYNFLKEKESILIRNDIRGLKDMVLREHSLFVKSRDLEVSRLSVLEVLAKKMKISIKDLTLAALAEKTGEKYRMAINDLRIKLKNTLEKIRHQNRKCEILIKKSMEIVNYSINLMTGGFAQKSKMVYNKDLRPDKKYYSNPLLDKRG